MDVVGRKMKALLPYLLLSQVALVISDSVCANKEVVDPTLNRKSVKRTASTVEIPTLDEFDLGTQSKADPEIEKQKMDAYIKSLQHRFDTQLKDGIIEIDIS